MAGFLSHSRISPLAGVSGLGQRGCFSRRSFFIQAGEYLLDDNRQLPVPADGFYGWKVVNGNKIPHHIRMKNSGVFAFAGLWDHWEGEGLILDSCTIIVMPSNEIMKPIHERMPAIIAPACYDWWLDARITDKQEIMQQLNPALSSQLTAYPVSTWVNVPKHDDEQCIQPAGS